MLSRAKNGIFVPVTTTLLLWKMACYEIHSGSASVHILLRFPPLRSAANCHVFSAPFDTHGVNNAYWNENVTCSSDIELKPTTKQCAATSLYKFYVR